MLDKVYPRDPWLSTPWLHGPALAALAAGGGFAMGAWLLW